MGRTIRVIGLLAIVIGAQPTSANPRIRSQFFNVYPSARGTKLDTLPSVSGHCGVCHYDFRNGGSPWNPYGLAVQAALPNFPNTDAGKSNAIYSVRMQDPDLDGFSALLEVTGTNFYSNVPTFPGLSAANIGQVMNVNVAEIQTNLVPATAIDNTPPQVTVISPNGGEIWVANRATNITWTASDPGGVAAVSIYLSIDNGLSYQLLAQGLPNSGSYQWYPANRPTAGARIKVVAADNALNTTNDLSNANFSIVSPPGGRVPTTLRDFDMPGTQPHQGGSELAAPTDCAACHGGYNQAVEPYFNWQGSMMAHASRDLLFEANLAIANQDAPDSGDLCLRCHFPRGWLAGRSVPTDGSSMQPADRPGVSCELCHRLVDPIFQTNASPAIDANILAALTFRDTNFGNGMFVIDPNAIARGPFTNAAAPHVYYASPFHREAALCGTCHDVSNPAFHKNPDGSYSANAFDAPSENFSPQVMAPVERTYSEWLHSEFNSSTGVYLPQFAGNKPDGRVSTCQDCHMRAVAGQGANPAVNPSVPTRPDLPLHDLTGGSTWLPGLLTNLYSDEVNAAAIQQGINRAIHLLTNAATLSIVAEQTQLRVLITNQCGHKLPTGYPEGRRMWLNVKFYDSATNLLAESGAYDPATGVLTRDFQAKVYEVHPGLETNLATALGLMPGPSFHFVLNNQVYADNRIPPRGFTNATFAAFGGAPVDYHYADGQYWDETIYQLPPNTARAEISLYYQSTSKEFVEFLRDENITNMKGQQLYTLWNENGKCPPSRLTSATWLTPFELRGVRLTTEGKIEIRFVSRPGTTYSIEYTDELTGPAAQWRPFLSHGVITAIGTETVFEDDFTSNTSGGPSSTGKRFYRFSYQP